MIGMKEMCFSLRHPAKIALRKLELIEVIKYMEVDVNKNENIVSSAAQITLMDVGVAVLAGFMIFPFVFSQGIETDGGAGLIFMTLPGVFQSLGPVLGVAVGAFFFLLLSFAAFTSTISLLEVLERNDFKAPEDWKGYRELTEK